MPLDELTERGRVFVGGPIQHALYGVLFDDDVRRVIVRITEQLQESGYSVLSAHLSERFGLDTSSLSPHEVTRRDFAWMQDCDIFIAVLVARSDGDLMRTDGTHIELGWASAAKKPIIILTPTACVPQLSHLVRGLDQITTVKLLSLEAILGGSQRLEDAIDELLFRDNEASAYQLAGAKLA